MSKTKLRTYTLVTYQDYPNKPGEAQCFEAADDTTAIVEMKTRVAGFSKYFLRREQPDGKLHYVYTQEHNATDNNQLMWWGYLHSNNTLQLKRWFGDHKDYTEDCQDNDFVQKVVPPFAANSREEALSVLTQKLAQ